MSEVGDAVQVVMLCGRSAILVGNISLKIAMQIAKLMNTIYLAKWEGRVSLNRLRQTKGDDFVFINVSSEKAADLAVVEKEMKFHGILFARMPDLCGGDARTQYAIASSDAVKMKAMLLDHSAGPGSVLWIKEKPIHENRYYAQFMMPDGKNTVFIRQADILPGRDPETGKRLAAVFTGQRYSMMNLEKVSVTAADGSKAIAMFKLPGGAVVAHSGQQPERKAPAMSDKTKSPSIGNMSETATKLRR